MSPNSMQILKTALALPEGERLELAEALFAASEPPVPSLSGEAWAAEIDRRSDEIDSGVAACLPWDQVKELARRRMRG